MVYNFVRVFCVQNFEKMKYLHFLLKLMYQFYQFNYTLTSKSVE